MTPPQASTAQITNPQQPRASHAFDEADKAPYIVKNPTGRFFIKNAVPMKGARPASDGKCMFMLQCFEVAADATPAQMSYAHFSASEARYMPYYGHISRFRGDAGLKIGYVHECVADATLSWADGSSEGNSAVVSGAQIIPVSPPRAAANTMQPRFGAATKHIQSYNEEIATLRAINAMRAPRSAPKPPRARVY